LLCVFIVISILRRKKKDESTLKRLKTIFKNCKVGSSTFKMTV